ncbi:MAG: CopD family protein [Rhodospirillales bacterium]|jgi:uncharacterized membrane protein
MYNAILDSLSPFAAALHALAAIIWVGGMFFAYLVLRPTLGHLEGPERLKIWAGVFPKFFGWVWISAIVLLITGYWQIFVDFGGLKGITIAIKLMMGIGILMVFIFFYLFFGPYEQFKKAVTAQDWAQAGERLNTIRKIVLINLKLGLITSAIGASGRLWAV